MTVSEAKTILQTYKLPLTNEQMKIYRIAFDIVSGSAFRSH